MCTNTSLPPSSPTTKPSPLWLLEPLDRSLDGRAVEASCRSRPGGRRRERRAPADARERRHSLTARTTVTCRPLVVHPDLDAQLRAWIDGSVPGSLQYGRMQEHVPGAVNRLDKAEPLLGVEDHFTIASSAGPLGAASSRGDLRKRLGRAPPVDGRFECHHRIRAGSVRGLVLVPLLSSVLQPGRRLRLIRSGHINTAIAWICAWPSRRRKKAASPSSTRCRSSGASPTLAPPQ